MSGVEILESKLDEDFSRYLLESSQLVDNESVAEDESESVAEDESVAEEKIKTVSLLGVLSLPEMKLKQFIETLATGSVQTMIMEYNPYNDQWASYIPPLTRQLQKESRPKSKNNNNDEIDFEIVERSDEIVAVSANPKQVPVVPVERPVEVLDEIIFKIKVLEDRITPLTTVLSFVKPGDSAKLKLLDEDDLPLVQPPEDLNIFVRNQSKLSWDKDTSTLIAREPGSTEFYMIYSGKMTIVNVRIAGDSPKDIDVPEALTNLDGQVTSHSETSSAKWGLHRNPSPSFDKSRPSLTESITNAEKTLQLDRESQGAYYIEKKELAYKSISIQVIDDRSLPEKDLLYPVNDVSVHIIGTEFLGKTNVSGIVSINDIPIGSRLLLSVKDKHGRVVPSLQEIKIGEDEMHEVFHLPVTRFSIYDVYTQAVGITQDSRLGSFCTRLVSDEEASTDFSGLSVSLNVEGDGPLYFNSFGPAIRQEVTGYDGRFCFYNVRVGLAEISVYDVGDLVTAFALPIFQGAHLEEVVKVADSSKLEIRLAAMVSVADQVYGSSDMANRLQTVEAIDLMTLGDQELFSFEGDGGMTLPAGATSSKGRVYTLSRAAEFESVLYNLNQQDVDGTNILPLLPRGFVEDLYHELLLEGYDDAMPWDPEMGTIVLMHGQVNENENIRFRLLDQNGNSAGEGWYFGEEDSDITRAVFFHLNRGVYTVIAETSEGYWVDVDTVVVDFKTVSLIQTGNKIRHKRLLED
ncbi:MAG: hypothetical protein CMP10_05540 [Zetaproteobacteria bacterium]|nr:hypothetical protein [Pseudobdellovibrionaceae bacterium]